jgi:hypothetical protein
LDSTGAALVNDTATRCSLINADVPLANDGLVASELLERLRPGGPWR